MLSRIGGLLAVLCIEVAHAQDPPGTSDDPVIEAVNQAAMQPCSCDCCLVGDRPKSEIVTFADGNVLDKKCIPAAGDLESPRCPTTCKAANADRILTASVETMDTSRFCNYKCKPSVQTAGSMCLRLTEKETAETVDETGNG